VDKRYRLTDNRQFQLVRKDGRSWIHRLVVLGALPNGLAITRFGFSTSRKLNRAVDRNRARRLLREVARALQPRVAPGWDIVLVARDNMGDLHCQALLAAVEKVMRQARLLTEGQAAATKP
jgi:ribonuclease P protein component